MTVDHSVVCPVVRSTRVPHGLCVAIIRQRRSGRPFLRPRAASARVEWSRPKAERLLVILRAMKELFVVFSTHKNQANFRLIMIL